MAKKIEEVKPEVKEVKEAVNPHASQVKKIDFKKPKMGFVVNGKVVRG